MGVGRGPWPPWMLTFLAKYIVFLVLSGKKQFSPLLAPHWKNFGKILQYLPLEKILPTPMNQAALMSRRIRAVEHRCAAGLAGAHPGLHDRILINYRIGNARKYARKLPFFAVYRNPANFCFPFSLLRHYQMPECFYGNNCCF